VGLTASFFGLGAALSNLLGQIVVERFGHVTSLYGSLILSIVPILLFSTMPETLGQRETTHRYHHTNSNTTTNSNSNNTKQHPVEQHHRHQQHHHAELEYASLS
jgi:hypothetical protein